MADYDQPTEPETDPEAPLKSSLFKRLVANLIAVTEGAAGAPRIRPTATNFFLAQDAFSGTGTPPNVVILDAGDLQYTEFFSRLYQSRPISSTHSVTLRIQFSTDNGATWSAVQTIHAASSNSGDSGSGSNSLYSMVLDLVTGRYYTHGVSGGTTQNTQILTIPANCDAIRFNYAVSGTNTRESNILIFGRDNRD